MVATVNTQISSRSMPQLRELMDIVIEAGVTNWQLAITVAMGHAADNPGLLLQPYQMLELMPLLAELSLEARERGLFIQPANNIGYFGPYESTLRNVVEDEIHWHGCNAGDTIFGIEADGTIKSCPGLPRVYAGGNVRDKPSRDMGDGRAARHDPPAHGRRSLGLLPRLLLCGGLHGGLHLDGPCLVRPAGQQSDVPLPGAGDGQGRASRRLVQVKDAGGLPFDHGEFEIVVEPVPAPVPERVRDRTSVDG
jgi:hypothetical protein